MNIPVWVGMQQGWICIWSQNGPIEIAPIKYVYKNYALYLIPYILVFPYVTSNKKNNGLVGVILMEIRQV